MTISYIFVLVLIVYISWRHRSIQDILWTEFQKIIPTLDGTKRHNLMFIYWLGHTFFVCLIYQKAYMIFRRTSKEKWYVMYLPYNNILIKIGRFSSRHLSNLFYVNYANTFPYKENEQILLYLKNECIIILYSVVLISWNGIK